MSVRAVWGIRGLIGSVVTLALLGGCGSSPPARPSGSGGSGGAAAGGGAGGGAVGVGGAAATGAAGTNGAAGNGAAGNGTAGSGAAGHGTGGTGTAGSAGSKGGAAGGAGNTGPGGAGGSGSMACGALGSTCCAADGGGETCNDSSLVCLADTSCSCAKALFGRYLLRGDGALLFETDPTSTAQTPVLDANTGIPLANVITGLDGASHGCALIGSSVWCWRAAASGNALGQLGNGATDTSGAVFRATQVLTAANQPLTNIAALAVADSGAVDSSCAITTGGSIYCWGDTTWLTNGGTSLGSPYAVEITTDGMTPLSGAIEVGISVDHACSVVHGATTNEIWCWGANTYGQLGTGDTKPRRYPLKVVGFTDPKKAIAFGSNEYGSATCAIDGANVRCWGSNDTGQLGQGNTTSPVLAPTIVTLMGGTTALSNVIDVVGGTEDNIRVDACAQTSAGAVYCWGNSFQSYPTMYGVVNVVSVGSVWRGIPHLLTSDGLYHVGSTTRKPNCGLLQ